MKNYSELSLFIQNDGAQRAKSDSDIVIRSSVIDDSNSPRLCGGYPKTCFWDGDFLFAGRVRVVGRLTKLRLSGYGDEYEAHFDATDHRL
jgi:hypothetical protein